MVHPLAAAPEGSRASLQGLQPAAAHRQEADAVLQLLHTVLQAGLLLMGGLEAEAAVAVQKTWL